MPAATPFLNNFNAGEVSPRADARTDLQKYYGAMRICENAYGLPTGGWVRRPGFYFVEEVKTSSKKVRLVGFDFSTVQAYILEFGDKYIRFYKDFGQIVKTGSAYELTTDYLEADLFQLKITQSADCMYIAHPSYAIQKITRTDHDAWTIEDFAEAKFDTTDNYPGAIAFFEERLFVASTNDEPQKIWGSASGDFEDFSLDPDDDSKGIEFNILSDKVDRVRWLLGVDDLIAGTVGGAWRIGSSSPTGEPMSATNVSHRRQAAIGAKDMDAELVKDKIIFVQRGGLNLLSMDFDYLKSKYLAGDLNYLAEHIAKGSTRALSGIVDIDFQQEPIPIIWCVRADGQLLGLVYVPEQEVWGWFRVVTDGVVESVAVIGEDDQENQVWVVVKRVIGGQEKRYVEYFTPHNFWSQIEDCFFVDSGLTYDSTPATTITGLDHLEGESVAILADGAVVPNKTVVSGTITLTTPASKVHVGLPYTSTLKPMKIEIPGGGTVQGKKKRIHELTVRFYETFGTKWGRDLTHLDSVPFGVGTDPVLFTGDVNAPFSGTVDTEANLVIVQDLPLPMTVLAIMPRMDIDV